MIANGIYWGYVGIYTYLKRRSIYNTQVGAVVGALPPVLGYSAAVGQQISILVCPIPCIMFLYMYGWQIQHFYGILFKHKEDYDRADYVMI